MNDFNSMFPNFLNQCLSLKNILTPIAYLLITGGWIATTLAGYQSGSTHFRAAGRIIVILMLLVFLPTWGNQIVSAVSDLVTNTLNVDPAKLHDQYEAALQLQKSADGSSSWWEKVFDFPASIMEALLTVVFLILGWLASVIEWWAYILQNAILFIGYALSPVFIGLLIFPSMQQIGRRYLLNLLGVMIWPLGWGVAGLITQGVLTFMTDHSFLSYQTVVARAGGEIGYSLQNLMGLAFLGVWIIFSTIAAPMIIQRAIATGSSVASDLFSGAFTAGYASGSAGMTTLGEVGSGSMGGNSGNKRSASAIKDAVLSGGGAGIVASAAAFETLITASLNEGRGGNSVIGTLARMNQRPEADDEKSSQRKSPKADLAGDQSVNDMINKSKNPEQ